MKVIHEWEEIKDNKVYECKAYEDGHIEKTLKEGQENVLSDSEMAQLEMQTNIEYLVELEEMNMEV